MKRTERSRYMCLVICTITTVISLLVGVLSGVRAQAGANYVHIEHLMGFINGSPGSYRTAISGKVVNSLPFDIANVEVAFIFPEDTEAPMLTKTIRYIAAQKSSKVRIVKKSRSRLTRFSSSVVNYVVLSDQVEQLLDYYHKTDDPVFRAAVVRRFSHMEADALPLLLECIDTSNRGTRGDARIVMNDLMCVNALTSIGDRYSIKPLLDLLVWYTKDGNLNLYEDVRRSISRDDSNPLRHLPAFRFSFDVSMEELVVRALTHTGGKGIPTLLRESVSYPDPVAQAACRRALRIMDKSSVASLLDERDPAVLSEIVAVLGEVRRGDAVVPMLELADRDREMTDSVDKSVLAMQEVAIEGLVQALGHQHASVAKHAEYLLRRLSPASIPRLREEVKKIGGEVPSGMVTVDNLVDALVAVSQVRTNKKIDAIFESAWQTYQTGDCRSAARKVDRIFDVSDHPGRHLVQIAKVYHCSGIAYAASGEIFKAVLDLQRAHALVPGDPLIAKDLSSVLLERGKFEDRSGHWVQAAKDFRESVTLVSSNIQARRLLWVAIAKANLGFLVVMGGSMFILILLLSIRAHP